MRNYQTPNPATGRLAESFPEISDVDTQAALNRAHTPLSEDWNFHRIIDRAQVVARAAVIRRARAEELAGLITLEMGKLIGESLLEVELSAALLEYYTTHAEEFMRIRQVPEARGSVIVTQPLGVIMAVEPWSFPYYQLAIIADPQIVFGNILIVKHARNVPQCAMAFQKVNALIDGFCVRGVTLTGSEKAGSAIAERAERQLKKAVLELGGSDPFVVLEDAELHVAVLQCSEGRLQSFEILKVGDPSDSSTTVGPLSTDHGLNGLIKQVEMAKSHGAHILMGRKRIDRPGFYMEPTIITDITKDNSVFHEETFGPVASLYIADNDEEAIQLANATKYGLGVCIFARDTAHAQAIAARIESGMVWINSSPYFAPELPFGGIKNSDFG